MSFNAENFIKIRPFGGIIIFDSILCDGEDKHIDTTNISCFTHIHEDHIKGIEDLLAKPNSIVLTTDLTKELIGAMKGRGFIKLKKDSFLGLKYDKIKSVDEYKISFHRANHILGTGQLLVRGNQGSVLYSSDFMLKGTDTDFKDIDVLILDGNHGSPSIPQNLLEPSKAKKELNNIIHKEINVRRRQINLRAHVGTLQKIMVWCDEMCPKNIPFFANPKDIEIASVYRNHSYDFREIKSDKEHEFTEITQFEQPYIHFLRLSAPKELCEIQDPMVTTVHFSDIRYSYDNTEQYVRNSGINLKEHATHNEILDYVEKIKPKMVVVDNSPTRLATSKNAIDLANAIEKKLKIPSTFLPKKRPSE